MPEPIFRSLALLICENMLTDPEGKRTFYGAFNGLAVPALPVQAPRIVVVVMVTTPRHPVELRLVIRSEDGADVVYDQAATLSPVKFEEPESEMGFILDGLVFKQSGKYIFELSTRDTIIAQRSLVISVKSMDPKGKVSPATSEAHR